MDHYNHARFVRNQRLLLFVYYILKEQLYYWDDDMWESLDQITFLNYSWLFPENQWILPTLRLAIEKELISKVTIDIQYKDEKEVMQQISKDFNSNNIWNDMWFFPFWDNDPKDYVKNMEEFVKDTISEIEEKYPNNSDIEPEYYIKTNPWNIHLYIDSYLKAWKNNEFKMTYENLYKSEKQIDLVEKEIESLLNNYDKNNLIINRINLPNIDKENYYENAKIDFLATMIFLEKNKKVDIKKILINGWDNDIDLNMVIDIIDNKNDSTKKITRPIEKWDTIIKSIIHNIPCELYTSWIFYIWSDNFNINDVDSNEKRWIMLFFSILEAINKNNIDSFIEIYRNIRKVLKQKKANTDSDTIRRSNARFNKFCKVHNIALKIDTKQNITQL